MGLFRNSGCPGSRWQQRREEWRRRRQAWQQSPYWGGESGEPGEWMHKRRFLFRRFVRFVMAAVVLFVVGMAGLAFVLTHLFGGPRPVTALVWLAGVGLALSVPILAAVIATRAFTTFANPLARLMAAADAVAEGDLSARVPEVGPGEFSRLARSFNRMVGELERSDRLRRSLTADVAHELRTPLHIIQGNLEGILDGVYQPTPEQINLLLDETRQLTRLVEDLRTLSLAEAGQLALEHAPVNAAELLADVATSFSGPAEAAGVSLNVEVPPGVSPLVITGDAGRLDQVLSNLVANALRYTPPGGVVTLRAAPLAGGARMQVRDNGRGIAAEDLPNIFDRFWRGDKTSRQAGTGLGLAIARQLVEAHGGTITVESQPGQGTLFTIDLPGAPQRTEPPLSE